MALEPLEERSLLAILLSEVVADNSAPIVPGQVRDVAPRELVFRFDNSVDPNTLFGIQIARSGDGIFGNGNDINVDPTRSTSGAFPNGFLGIGDRPSEVIVRFGEVLPDDFYRITIFGSGPNAVRDLNGVPFNNGLDSVIDFRLALGAQVLGVVPQPITRDSFGTLQQARNEIDVYFNDDDLDPISAQDPSFYHLIFTNTTTTNTDDVVYHPSSVTYDSFLNKATLTFASNLDQLGSGLGTYRLRIGSNVASASQAATEVPVAISTGIDAGSSYSTAQNLTPVTPLNRQGMIVSGNIDAQDYGLTLPGSIDEPGHRQIPAESHLSGIADHTNGITTIYYDFRRDFGVDPLGNPLTNVIQDNPAQVQRAREALEFYSHFLGVQFVETNPAPGTPSIGFTIATGDMRVVSQTAAVAANDGITGIAGLPNIPVIGGIPVPVHSIALAVMDSSESGLWGSSEFGGNFFREVMREVGQLLGYGLATEIPDLTLNQGDLLFIAPGSGNTVEPVFPGDADIVHGQYLYRPESKDIDLYQFNVAANGTFRAETFAERLPTSSLLNSVITLFGDVRELVLPANGGAGLSDGQTFTLSDGVHVVTFEFDDLNLLGTSAGHRSIAFSSTDTADVIAQKVSDAISDTPNLGISPAAHFNRVRLSGALDADVSLAPSLSLDMVRQKVASNDDYHSDDSYLEVTLSPGTYYIGVSARGNSSYDPTIADSGFGGTSQGQYQLRVNFTPAPAQSLVDIDGTPLDGDVDGVPGGDFNFWFQVSTDANTIYVDKAFTGAQLGTLANPFNNIQAAFAAANAQPGSEIIRIVGNGGGDGDISTLADNLAYAVGFNTNGLPLGDGTTLNVPGRGNDPNGGTTVMIDPGAIFKMRLANVDVGSSAQNVDRSLGHLQVLGIPGQPVYFTSALDETIGNDVTPTPTTPAGGNWGGLVFRNNLDYAENRPVLEQQGIFLNIVNGADIRYGGGDVTVNSVSQRFTPIHLTESRPTISNNTITRSSDAAMSADPKSFLDTSFVGPDFTADYERHGPHIRRNTLATRLSNGSVAQNSVNGMFVRIRTQVVAGQLNVLDLVEGDARFDDIDIPHILAENLVIKGTPQGSPLSGSEVVVTSGLAADEAIPGNPANDTIATAVNTTLPLVPSGQYRVFRDTGFIGDNPAFVGNPQPDRDVDFFRFDLAAGSRATINVNVLHDPLDVIPTLDANLRLFDSNGVELAFSDSNPSGTEGFFGANVDPYIEFVAPTTGTYYVAVAGAPNRNYNPLVAGTGPANGVLSTGTYDIEVSVSTAKANLDSRLRIDPGLLIKSAGSRIETQIGSQFIAEGTQDRPIVFTSLRDDRFGGGGTFDTNADQANTFTSPGDWGGIFLGHLSQGSLDHTLVTFAGGLTRIEGTSDRFNALEIHQADARVTNSIFENNAAGLATTLRSGRAENAAATIFVRGAQPILVNNIIRNGAGAAISINANALQWQPNEDWGHTTGLALSYEELDGNQGPLVKGNRLGGNGLNGMEVRGGRLTTQTVWDDTDIVHVVTSEIVVPNHHVYSGLRLQSSPDESLVVKLSGATAGFTATGTPLDINDRIGGTVQIVGKPGFPVILTGLGDDTVGAGLDPNGNPQLDTAAGQSSAGGQWRSVRLQQYSNDRNVESFYETEAAHTNGTDTDGTPSTAQFLGQLAPNEKAGDENRRLGFELRGTIAFDSPGDVDVYSFLAEPGTEVWIDIDRTTQSLDTVLELVDAAGNVIARSDDSDAELHNPSLLAGLMPGNLARLMARDVFNGVDVYTENPRDAGMRVVLPSAAAQVQTYFVRVYSKNAAPAGDPYQLGAGDTSGHYDFQIRLREADEVPGSTVRYSDIRFATNGIEVLGLPAHSPLVGDSAESPTDNGNEGNGAALNVGNLLQSDLGSLSLAGSLATATDVDWFQFTVDYDQINFLAGLRTIALAFDIDYADGIGRPDTVLTVFDSLGRVVLVARDSDILDDQLGPTSALGTSDLSRGSFGKLDPYIGPQQFPAGQTAGPALSQRYFVAVSSNAQLPNVLDGTFESGATNSTVRIEPIQSVRRIAEDHIGFNGHTSGNGSTNNIMPIDPVTPSLFDIENSVSLEANVKPFTLADVPLFVSSNFDVFTVNANTGLTETFYNNALPGFNESVEDIDFRSDGQLFGYATAAAANNQNNAGRLISIDTQTGAVASNNGGDNIQDATVNTSQVDALTIDRTGANAAGVPQYDFIYYSVRLPNFATPSSLLFDANAAGNANVTNAGAGNRGLIGEIMVNTSGDVGVTTGLALDSNGFQLYGVTDQGDFIAIDRFGFPGAGLATVLLSLPGMEFQGLTQGPQNLDFNQDGVYGDLANTFFAITTTGAIVCIDVDPITGVASQRAVFDSNGDGVLENVLQTGAFSPTGLAFSPVDFNLWHPTMQRRNDAGHGVNASFDQDRFDPQNVTHLVGSDFDVRTQTELNGGASFYYGLESWVQNPFPNDYFNYSYDTAAGFQTFSNAQYGILDSTAHRDLMVATGGTDNYNLPGGAKGSLQTNAFSLEGYAATDKPTLYFNYFLATENVNSTTNTMRDSARVQISSDGGLTWFELATNNGSGTGDNTDPFRNNISELPRFSSANSNVDSNPFTADPRQRIQELFDNTGGWRQARIDLGEFAGQKNLQIRFDFSTAGTMDEGVPGDEYGRIFHESRFQNNTSEGFYVDDVIIGFAERGEMVTGAPANTNFSTVPINPNGAAPQEILTGEYQLEVRASTEIGANIFVDATPIISGPSFSYPEGFIMDTNQRLTEGFTILAPQPEQFRDTQTRVNSLFAPNVLTYQFTNTVPATGPGTLTFTAVGDLFAPNEFLTVNLEGIVVQNIFITGGQFYAPVTASIQLTQAQLALLTADGVINMTVTPSVAVEDFFLPTSLQADLVYAIGSTTPEGETFTINDGLNSVTFEFDSVGGVRPGNVPVPFTRTQSAAQIAATMVSVINASLLNTTATVTPTSNRVNLNDASFVNTGSTDDLIVNLNAGTVRENGPGTTATVRRTGSTASAILVQVTAVDPVTGLASDEINLNGSGSATTTILIPAGSSLSAPFSVVARDDALLDLTQTANLVATFVNFNSVSAPIDVQDDELGLISVTINTPSIAENAGANAAIGTVTLNIPAQQDVLVSLLSSDTSEATAIGSVLIPAGQISANFNINAVPDFVVDGNKSVKFTASAVGFLSGFGSVTVNDLGNFLPLLPFVGPNVNTTRSSAHESEPAIMINPTNPANLFMFTNRQPGNGMLASVSQDSGATWTTRGFADGLDGLTLACCDPAGAFDRFGNLFITYLSDVNTAQQAVIVALSTNGGLSFTQIAVLDTQSDQPGLAVGDNSVWVYFDNGNPQIAAAGAAITGLGNVGAFTAPQIAPGSLFSGFGDVVVGPNGEVVVAYQDKFSSAGPANISINRDLDGLGPGGFSPSIFVTSTNVGAFDSIPAQPFRTIDAEADLDWDRSVGAFRGRLYMVYTDENPQESGDTDIFLRSSDDNGTTWSLPRRVNDDSTTNSQFFPRLVVDQTTGNLAISWYDARNDDGIFGAGDRDGFPNNDVQLYATFSTNGGQTFFPNFQVSAGTTNGLASGNFNELGDYTGLDFYNGVFYPVWTDNSGSTGTDVGLPSGEIYTARIALAPLLGAVSVDIAADSIDESGASNSTTFVVTRTGSLVNPLTVFLNVVNPGEVSGIPVSVVIPAGSATSAPITITAVDDQLANAGQAVIILPLAQGYDATSDSVLVQDNDLPQLTLAIDPPRQITNGDGPGAIFATITRNTLPSGDLVVNITSHDLSEVRAPFSVVIPAGLNSVTFPLDAFLEFGFDGTQSVQITASAPTFISGHDSLDVMESPSFESFERFGDGNIVRPQGQVIIQGNRISNSSEFGIVVDASARDGNGNKPHPGAVRNTRELNLQRWVPSVVVENNLVTFSGLGGIHFSGDPNAGTNPLSAIPFGRIINNTVYGSDIAPTGVGIEVQDFASPTVMNNIVSRLVVGVSISADSASTVLGGTLYRENTTHAATPASIGLGSFDLDLDLLSPLIPLFRNPAAGDFTLVEGSLAIDSSIDSFSDRPELLAVTQPLGISQSPILAPQADLLGRLRIDNPLVASPPGLGLNVFKDRGALERLDPVTVGVNSITVTEGDAGTTFAVFNVALSEVLSIPFSIVINTASGSATAGLDFLPSSGTLSFQPGESTKLVSISVLGDQMDEDDETFTLNLSSPSAGAALTNFQGTATILDDDGPPSLSVFDQSVFEGDVGLVNVVLTLTLSAASGRQVTVDYNTANGTASNATDYVSAAGTVTFTPGISTAALTMQTRGDKAVEADETFVLNLANPVNATLATPAATVTIIDDDAAVNINNVSVAEGNAGTVDAVFTVSLTKPASSPVTVTFVTTNVTAIGGVDYTGLGGTISFAPLETVKTITVQVLGDTIDEANETFNVQLSSPVNAVLGSGIGVGTIVDDDLPPTVAITSAVTVDPEGDAGTTNAIFLVTLNAVSGQQVLVPYNTQNGPLPNGATAGLDYTAVAGTLTFLAGITQQSIVVPVLGDTAAEANETFLVNIVNPVNAVLAGGQSQGVATIVDDEPRMSINDRTITEPDIGSQFIVFTATLTRTSSQPITVVYATTDGTAQAVTDYIAVTGDTLTFAPGEFQKTISVAVLGDPFNEGSETFSVNLSNISAGAVLADGVGIGTIVDNDPVPTISISDASRTEGNSGNSPLSFVLALSAPSGQQITVRYATSNGTATAGNDYVAATGTATFAPGETQQTINVLVRGDTLVETDETFFVNLSSPVNAFILDGQAQGTILDDEAQLSIDNVSVAEGNGAPTNAVFTLSLSKVVSGNVIVNFATADGTAVAGQDYSTVNGAATFAPGETVKKVSVPIVGDLAYEGPETFVVNLSGATGATLADNQGVATITDDDPPPVLFLNSVTVTEGDSGTQVAALTVSLSSPINRQVTVNYATANGSAIAGVDYLAAAGVLTFAPGETIQQLALQVVGDTQPEGSETFQVVLSGAVNAAIGGPGTITIRDNDPLAMLVTGADAGGGPHVKVFDPATGQERLGFFAYAPTFTGGVRVATADINNDGQADIITVPGAGGGPHLRILDGRTLGVISEFFAFETSYTGGLTVATGDVNLDGRPDIIVGTEGGDGARVRIFNGADRSVLNTFNFPATTAFRGGVRVGAGDVNGDGRADILVANGPGNTPRVLVIDAQTGATIRDFFAYTPAFGGGIYVAAADIDLDGRADIITGAGSGGGPHVRVFSGATGAVLSEFFAYGVGFGGGVRVGTIDGNGDGRPDIITGAGPTGGPHVRVFDAISHNEIRGFLAYGGFTGGIFVAGSKTNALAGSPLMAASGSTVVAADTTQLTAAELQPILRAATDRWAAAGVDSAALARLKGIEVRVADLPDGYLGMTFPSAIYVDANAAGYGWFADSTPDADEEFAGGIGSGAAAGRMDLLSAVMHELGHALGLADVYGDHDDGLMAGLLGTGTRRTPALSAVDSVFSDDNWN